MARDPTNGNNGWPSVLSSWLRLAVTLGALVFGAIQLKVAPLEQEVARLKQQVEGNEADRRKADETLWKALKDHEDKPGHEGISAKVAGLEREVVGNNKELIDAREAASSRDVDRKRELDHVWQEIEDMRSSTCNNGRKP